MHIRLLASSAVIGCVFALVPAIAHADSAVRNDPRGDAVAAIDITKVRYRHAPQAVSARVCTPDLSQRGRVLFRITSFDIFEAGYIAVLRKRPDGSLSKRLRYFDHFDTEPRRGDVEGSRRARAGVVRVAVPRDCLDGHRQPRLYLDAIAAIGNRYDRAPAATGLTRG